MLPFLTRFLLFIFYIYRYFVSALMDSALAAHCNIILFIQFIYIIVLLYAKWLRHKRLILQLEKLLSL